MRHRALEQQPCSIARTVAVLGERWTMVILRQAFQGERRFEDIQRGLGIARNILADRLQMLVSENSSSAASTRIGRPATSTD